MATIKFSIQSKNSNAPIFLRLSISGTIYYKRKTRETINPESWNSKKGTPKNLLSGTAEGLQDQDDLKSRLLAIQKFVLDQYKNRVDTEIINGRWLEETIVAFYTGGKKLQQLDYLDNFMMYYRENILPFRKHRGNQISESTVKKQKTIIAKILQFVQSQNVRLKVSDFDLAISNRFEKFLQDQGISRNTIGRYIKYPKTIIGSAKSLGIEVSSTLSEIKGFTMDTPTIFITEEELQQVAKIKFLKKELEDTKDWLIIGFYTGQRGGDLLQMSKRQIEMRDGHMLINLSQKKTKHPVMIPVKSEVYSILMKRKGDFPDKFSENIESAKTIFNRNLREVARISKLDRIEQGKKWNKDTKKFDYGSYPLHEIISSHICRRSFATHYYAKMPTPIITAITGHKTEKEFLKYIGKNHNDLSMEIFSYWQQEKISDIELSQETI